ncbi:3d966109-2415-469b-ab7f-5eadf8c21010 [Thermothielavioides terrestris]|uniref:3d966109-2415-469b-ab7f-5eadf8c21010 n=1 Tax=Thermothielavioides terrestris TaxID=2587410 RepID=A0A3S4EWY6_9PEZI|nr:3d966109-2415-469b-ab7f-5eadf8c21010 [Thermothielavioides terrestris]
MLVEQPLSAKTRSRTTRPPQIHTRKNHDTYNGVLRLPQTIHVHASSRPQDRSCNDTTTTASPTDSRQTYCYTITLHYPHNRACEIYRSRDEVHMLRRKLSSVMSRKPRPSPNLHRNPNSATGGRSPHNCRSHDGGGGYSNDNGGGMKQDAAPDRRKGHSSSRVRVDATASNSTPGPFPASAASPDTITSATSTPTSHRTCICSCTCSCPCPCPVPGADAQAARDLHQLLEETLRRVKDGDDHGGVRVLAEWFLRRRMGDCGGR